MSDDLFLEEEVTLELYSGLDNSVTGHAARKLLQAWRVKDEFSDAFASALEGEIVEMARFYQKTYRIVIIIEEKTVTREILEPKTTATKLKTERNDE